jgi:hypothetical protein
VYGVHGVHTVVACRGEVGADPAEPAEGALRVPVRGHGHGLMSLGVLDRSLELFVHSTSKAVANSQTCSAYPASQHARAYPGWLPLVPVLVAVVGLAEGHRLVVAGAQPGQQAGVHCGLAGGFRCGDRVVGLVQDAADVVGPVLQAAGAKLGDLPAAADDVLAALLDAFEGARQPLVGPVAVNLPP